MIKTVWTTAVKLASAPDRWLDQLQERLDQRGPRRTVSRFTLVRRTRALAGRFDVRGWFWTLLTGSLVGVMAARVLHPVETVAVLLVAYGAIQVGSSWARRNEVGNLHVVTSCECDPFHDGEDA